MATDAIQPAASLPFHHWRRAFATLRHAETHRRPYSELVSLSEDVIRTRNILIAGRLADGFTLPDEGARQVAADAELLRHRHDTA